MTWYQAIVFIHIISAVIWVGGIFFLGLIAVPAVRRLQPEPRHNLMMELGLRFRNIGYTLLVVLIITGVIQAGAHGATVTNVLNGTFFQTRFGATLGAKLLFFVAMLAVSITHDFIVGPASVRAGLVGPESDRLRRLASWLARLTAVLALGVLAYATLLVR